MPHRKETQTLIPPHEHCWHSYTSMVARTGKNVHGPYCVTHPDLNRPHEHSIVVHKQKCCLCPANRVQYDEYIDTGEKETKKKR